MAGRSSLHQENEQNKTLSTAKRAWLDGRPGPHAARPNLMLILKVSNQGTSTKGDFIRRRMFALLTNTGWCSANKTSSQFYFRYEDFAAEQYVGMSEARAENAFLKMTQNVIDDYVGNLRTHKSAGAGFGLNVFMARPLSVASNNAELGDEFEVPRIFLQSDDDSTVADSEEESDSEDDVAVRVQLAVDRVHIPGATAEEERRMRDAFKRESQANSAAVSAANSASHSAVQSAANSRRGSGKALQLPSSLKASAAAASSSSSSVNSSAASVKTSASSVKTAGSNAKTVLPKRAAKPREGGAAAGAGAQDDDEPPAINKLAISK